MKKIISLFQRNYDGDKLVRDEIVPGAEWVVAGEGVATRKWDGTCCLIRDGRLYKRYEVKPGGKPPTDFEPANDVDGNTGKQQGWVPVTCRPDDRWHREAWGFFVSLYLPEQSLADLDYSKPLPLPPETNGTYELCGPRVQGNPDNTPCHGLIRHGGLVLADCPRDFAGIKAYLAEHDIEGVVWHHDDGRMVKIKGKDFGIKRWKK